MERETNYTDQINNEGFKVRQELEQLLSSNNTSDYTVITLMQDLNNQIEWNDYFYFLSQFIFLKKIHIEEDGYISWLWNPDLIKKIHSDNLLLE